MRSPTLTRARAHKTSRPCACLRRQARRCCSWAWGGHGSRRSSVCAQDPDVSKVRLLEAQLAAATQKPDELEPMVRSPPEFPHALPSCRTAVTSCIGISHIRPHRPDMHALVHPECHSITRDRFGAAAHRCNSHADRAPPRAIFRERRATSRAQASARCRAGRTAVRLPLPPAALRSAGCYHSSADRPQGPISVVVKRKVRRRWNVDNCQFGGYAASRKALCETGRRAWHPEQSGLTGSLPRPWHTQRHKRTRPGTPSL